MKNFIFLFSLFLFIACQDQSADSTYEPSDLQPAIISGEILNSDDDVKINLYTDDEPLSPVVEDNKFIFEVDVDEPTFADLRFNRKYFQVYLTPGSNSEIIADMSDEGTYTFSGDWTNENQYLQKKAEESQSDDPYVDYKLDESAFAELQLSKREDNVKRLAEAGNLAKDFAKIEEANILYDWAGAMNNYPSYYEYFAKVKGFEPTEEFLNWKGQVDMNDGSKIGSQSFRSFVSSSISSAAQKKLSENESMSMHDYTKTSLDLADEKITDVKVKSFAYAKFMSDHLKYEGVDNVDELYSRFKELVKNPKYLAKAQKYYDQWAPIAKGKTAPGFDYVDIEGKNVAMKDFAGKYVYVDVWATWCGPCKAEIPSLKELEEKYAGNSNIVFTSISIDEDKDAWKKMVEEDELGGVQLFADGAWQSSICDDYLIKGIPRFMLIDKEGKIVSANAPRPSSDECKELLASLLETMETSMKLN